MTALALIPISPQRGSLNKHSFPQVAPIKYSIEGIFIESYIRSRHGHMRELRTQQGGRPFRTLYAFDPRRNAILLIGGDKTGDDRWYEKHVPIADHLYDEHLLQLRKEGLIDE